MKIAPLLAASSVAISLSVTASFATAPATAAQADSEATSEAVSLAALQLHDHGVAADTVALSQSPLLLPTDGSQDLGFTDSRVSIRPLAVDEGGFDASASGLLVHEGEAGVADTVLQPTRAGFRLLTVATDPSISASASFHIDLPNNGLVAPTPEGGLVILRSDGFPVAAVERPWAMDASGQSLPTEFSVDGDTVHQRVDTSGADFPVVADPAVTKLCDSDGCPANLESFEAEAAAAGAKKKDYGAYYCRLQATNKITRHYLDGRLLSVSMQYDGAAGCTVEVKSINVTALALYNGQNYHTAPPGHCSGGCAAAISAGYFMTGGMDGRWASRAIFHLTLKDNRTWPSPVPKKCDKDSKTRYTCVLTTDPLTVPLYE